MRNKSSSHSSYEVYSFEESVLCSLLAENSDTTREDVNLKLQFRYLYAYLKHIKVKSIIVERDYVDRAFLEDHADYYIRSFQNYARYCVRLHFFTGHAFINYPKSESDTSQRENSLIDDLDVIHNKEFQNFLNGRTDRINTTSINNGYVGFTVIRPLPQMMIGRTCLKHYDANTTINPSQRTTRHYCATRDTKVSLFGIQLNITDTLPFQEQDSVVSACATSALWSFLHGANSTQKLVVPSPSSITRSATKHSSRQEIGLNAAAIERTIKDYGLEPINFNVEQELQILRENVYAYMSLKKEPVLLGMDIYKRKAPDSNEFDYAGNHLVTIVGFGCNKNMEEAFWTEHENHSEWSQYKKSGFFTLASTINKLYVHDDQTGPFARLKMVTDSDSSYTLIKNGSKRENVTNLEYLEGIIKDNDGNNLIDDIMYIPNEISLGLYHKIRAHYISVRTSLGPINVLLNNVLGECPSTKDFKILWDVSLVLVSDYKETIFEAIQKEASSRQSANGQLTSLLLKRLPRFIWKCTLWVNRHETLDLLLDATDGSVKHVEFLAVLEYSERNDGLDHLSLKNIKKILHQDAEKHGGAKYEFIEDCNIVGRKFFEYIFQGDIISKRPSIKDELFGSLKIPSTHHVHEAPYISHASTKKLIVHTINHKNTDNLKLSGLDTGLVYLWLIDELGDFCYSVETEIEHEGKKLKLGHPCINGGAKARIAGELKHKDDHWLITNESGRYVKRQPDMQLDKLKMVLHLLELRGFITSDEIEQGIIKPKVNPHYNEYVINDFNKILCTLKMQEFHGGTDNQYRRIQELSEFNSELNHELVQGLPVEPVQLWKIVYELGNEFLVKEDISKFEHIEALQLLDLINILFTWHNLKNVKPKDIEQPPYVITINYYNFVFNLYDFYRSLENGFPMDIGSTMLNAISNLKNSESFTGVESDKISEIYDFLTKLIDDKQK